MSSKPRYYHIYCDESSHRQQRHFLFGAILVNRAHIPALSERFDEFRESHQMFAELKWTKVSRQKLSAYQALVDLFMGVQEDMRFGAVVVDTLALGRWKAIFDNYDAVLDATQCQLVTNISRKFLSRRDAIVLYADQRQSMDALVSVANSCNSILSTEYGFAPQTVREAIAVDSRDHWEIQVADVLMGAIAFELNGNHEAANSSGAKRELAEYIRSRTGVNEFASPDETASLKFAIWKLNEKKSDLTPRARESRLPYSRYGIQG